METWRYIYPNLIDFSPGINDGLHSIKHGLIDSMDTSNPVIQLIIQGTQAEYAKQMDQACHLYRQAWDICKDAYEFTMAAHYVARCQPTPQERLHWNQIALKHAHSIIPDPRISPFLPSLYLNLGKSYEETGNFEKSDHYFQLAAALGFNRQPP